MGNACSPLICCKPEGTKKGFRVRKRGISLPRNLNSNKWEFVSRTYDGAYLYQTEPDIQEESGTIESGIAELQDNPEKYDGIIFQTDMKNWPEDQQMYRLVIRNCSGFRVGNDDGPWTFIRANYQALPALDEDEQNPKDDVTDSILTSYSRYPTRLGTACPGRGAGVEDTPLIKVIGYCDPNDVFQGQVGDCWFLSALSCCAEFRGVIEKILSRTDYAGMPHNEFNTYIVTLYNLPEFEETDIVVDERLITVPEGFGGAGKPLGCLPSPDGELWAAIIEKAVAAHVGGWDELDGGNPFHAWKLLLGIEDCFCILRTDDGMWRAWQAAGQIGNSPHSYGGQLVSCSWPDDSQGPKDTDELFEFMCAWDEMDFILAAGSKRGSGSDKTQTGGIVDSHAYGVLKCVEVDGFELLQLRNPWGKSGSQNAEFDGKWGDNGPGWEENPHLVDQLNVTFEDDGQFWMEKDAFFAYFDSINVCPMDMKTWVSDEY